jgi:hypothetical protein
MAELRNLHEALASLAEGGRTGKVSFYFLGDDMKLQSGSIVVEEGNTCYVHFGDRAPDDALATIAGLKFAKVTTLPSMGLDHSGDVAGLPMTAVLERLDPGKHTPPPAAEPPRGPVEPRPVAATAAPVEPRPAPKPHVFYSHVAMQKDALELLESLFGSGAAKKVDEFARQSPPHQYPADFLGKCRQHAAMMLGAKKAEELFAPLFAKLTH